MKNQRTLLNKMGFNYVMQGFISLFTFFFLKLHQTLMNAKITNFFCNSFKNWNQCTNLAPAGSSNEVDGLLFLLHPLDVVGQTGLFRVRVRGVEPKQFGQTSSVGLVLNHSQFNAGKNNNQPP